MTSVQISIISINAINQLSIKTNVTFSFTGINILIKRDLLKQRNAKISEMVQISINKLNCGC